MQIWQAAHLAEPMRQRWHRIQCHLWSLMGLGSKRRATQWKQLRQMRLRDADTQKPFAVTWQVEHLMHFNLTMGPSHLPVASCVSTRLDRWSRWECEKRSSDCR
jgi:hypothetical protein